MASEPDAGNFDVALGCLLSPALEELAARLVPVAGLHPRECGLVVAATRDSLLAVLHGKLTRLLILELNAARVTGRLTGADTVQRWEQFLLLSSQADYWRELAVHYPTLLPRVARVVDNRCAASLRFGQRWAADRDALHALCGSAAGQLQALSFGAGDSHRQGQTVALLQCDSGKLVYKPRSVAVDQALRAFIAGLAKSELATHDVAADELSIQVPRVVDRGDYGWGEFVEHRFASGHEELRRFYRGIGQWLAVMRLLGGSDLHAENLIAHGDMPVIVDCETLFTPRLAPSPSGLGQALDQAAHRVSGTVLNVGLLPGRGIGLGWRGVDNSAVGMLPGQQPPMPLPGVLGAGSDQAHIGTTLVQVPLAQNHPSPQPALAQYWPDVLDAFDMMTATLRRLDTGGALQARLHAFADCRIRVVCRSTEVYAEVARMLWHPVSLHNPGPARERAHGLLAKMADNVSSAPNAPAVIDAEIDDLLDGDIPFFATLPRDGQLEGPRGTHWLARSDRVEDALRGWREGDLALDRNVIQAALVSAYINDGWMPEGTTLKPASPRAGDLDARRRRQAAGILEGLVASAIRAPDGSVAWIAPVLSTSGWAVQPLEQDLYGGASGIAVLIAAYLRETAAGRADPVDGLDVLLADARRTLALAEAKRQRHRDDGIQIRPPAPGGYLGLGSQIWAQLVLARWSMDGGTGTANACALADAIPDAVAADTLYDVLAGGAGAIAPLLSLADASGDAGYRDMACAIGDSLCERAHRAGDRAWWVNAQWPDGVGGFAHGVTGIGWALAKLAERGGRVEASRYAEIAEAAFAFEEALFDADERNWRDLRMLDGAKTAAAWCHGSVGIGLAHVDLDPGLALGRTRSILRRAAAATWRMGMGWNHCACHGDAGALELLGHAVDAGDAPDGLSKEALLATFLTSLEDHGAVCGIARDAFVPGLLPGLGGVAYQLLRAHPDSALPSILTLQTERP